ncbi:MAG TPA: plastocyanin/azurin family copper-binding protein [Solirubrobacteraceae bacterium]|nr:plastocyanin/azurin family copper-binding protein [Solirubrobacteraceae bacterium]
MKKLAALAALAAAISVAAALAIPAFAATTVRVDDDVFRPGSLTVSKGTTVRWRWVGDDLHNVTVTRGPVKFKSATKRSGTFSKKMRRRGRYRIVCTVHPGMDMRLRVR